MGAGGLPVPLSVSLLLASSLSFVGVASRRTCDGLPRRPATRRAVCLGLVALVALVVRLHYTTRWGQISGCAWRGGISGLLTRVFMAFLYFVHWGGA